MLDPNEIVKVDMLQYLAQSTILPIAEDVSALKRAGTSSDAKLIMKDGKPYARFEIEIEEEE